MSTFKYVKIKNSTLLPFWYSLTMFVPFLISLISTDYFLPSPDIYPPRIFPNKLHTNFRSGENFTLNCFGKRPLTWQSPKIPIEYGQFRWAKVRTETLSGNDLEKEKFGLKLIVTNASFYQTGYFRCSYCDKFLNVKKEELYSAPYSQIYVFVRDSIHLSVNPNPIQFIDFNTIGPLIIPCRPTSPSVHLQLKRPDSEFNLDSKYYLRYNQEIGFSFLNYRTTFKTNLFRREKRFKCVFNWNNHTEEILMVLAHRKEENLRFLDPPEYLVKGDNFTLRLSITNWNSGIIYCKTPRDRSVQKYSFTNLLKIGLENVTLYDSGSYMCFIEEKLSESYYTMINLEVRVNHNVDLPKPIQDLCVLNQESTGSNTTDLLLEFANNLPNTSRFDWHCNNETLDNSSGSFQIEFNESMSHLRIFNSTYSSNGMYSFVMDFSFSIAQIQVNIINAPDVYILRLGRILILDQMYKIQCGILANPKANVSGYFNDNRCKNSLETCQESVEFQQTHSIGSVTNIEFQLKIQRSGIFTCEATNLLGTANDSYQFLAKRQIDVFHLDIIKPIVEKPFKEIPIIHGDQLIVECKVILDMQYERFYWDYDRIKVEGNLIQRKIKGIFEVLELTIANTTSNLSKPFCCNLLLKNNIILREKVRLNILEAVPPQVAFKNIDLNIKSMDFELGSHLVLNCLASGTPSPQILWYKNSKLIPNESEKIFRLNYLRPNDTGTYRCFAENRLGTASRTLYVRIKDSIPNSGTNKSWLIVSVIILSVLIGVLIVIFVRYRRRTVVTSFESIDFVKGRPDLIDFTREINEQAEFLPYDRKRWEIGRERIKLGPILGSGAFGTVHLAQVRNLINGEAHTNCAVKMIKPSNDELSAPRLKALIIELKILIHLGYHTNVVNLLGAYTDAILDHHELFILLEYCHHGNLQKFLRIHREHFLDLVDHSTGNIDPNLRVFQQDNAFYYYHVFQETDEVDLVIDSNSDSALGSICLLSTRHLIEWSYQIASGMEFLAAKRVIHGDLAARNVLLADNNLVKICDFGLARSLYDSDLYRKKTMEALPIRWMALESLQDYTFSTKSDVWSYGILLWELFSLGMMPYQGMETNQLLINKLNEGYRMTSPEYAPKCIYNLMKKCWSPVPSSRPEFSELTTQCLQFLENIENANNYYLEMNI